jgi:monofunctional biosynthetic peptidoglycan transglycosylase
MARAKQKPKDKDQRPARRPLAVALRWLRRAAIAAGMLAVLGIAGFAVLPVPTTPYMLAERLRLDRMEHRWVPMADIAPVMARSAVAAEDADFCAHWGFDIAALRAALDGGARRGGSTISQQTVKNVFLWQGRSWPRKALEALLTPAVELAWPKRRILEVYLNVAEFDEGVFGVEAAAQSYFGVSAANLSPLQAARLAAILPDPKGRSASEPSDFVRRRTASIMDGAATIQRDGRAACFEGAGAG